MKKKVIHNVRLLFAALAIMIISYTPAYPQGAHVLHMKAGNVQLTENAGRWLDSLSQKPALTEPADVIIHFSAPVTSAQREILERNGITLLNYIPDNSYSALIKSHPDETELSSVPLYSIISNKPEWKADASLWKRLNGKTGTVEVMVSFLRSLDDATIRQFISSMGAQADPGNAQRYGYYKIIADVGKIFAMAHWYGVRNISPVSNIVPLDLQARPAVMGNIADAATTYGGYALTGDSVTIGVGDESSGIYHADVRDRITNFNPAPQAHHGEFVNGIAGGAAIVDPLATTMTPHVSLLDFYFDLMLPETGTMYSDYNMTITNNSYEVIAGDCSYAGTYDGYAQLVDTLTVAYPYVEHVFAGGNDGLGNCAPYPAGFATVGGGYQPAKNIIAVGSMTDYFIQADDESRGPVKDGRLKPDMIAIGLTQYSCIGVDQYEWAAGTSFASPQVAGGLAALTQYYKQRHGEQPRTDLLKTLILNGAQDLGNPGPDYSYGFGGMDMHRSLLMMDSGYYNTGSLGTGDSQSFHITVPPNTGTLKVMLCWNDVPADPAAAIALVNDLDLTVQDPSSATHLPLVLNPDPPHVNDAATEQADHLNNVEQVTINNPAAGTYTLKTKGYNVPSGPQAYVVAYDMIPNQLYLTFPRGGEQLDNIDSIRIFWEAITDTNTFTAQFSQDNGSTWTTLYNNIPPNARYCAFMPTGINSGNCLVRVSKNNTSQTQTSQRFVINTRPVAVADSIQCPGYVNIHWSPIPGATSYYLLKKSGFYLQVVDSTGDTSYSFSGMPLDQNSYVTMQPILNGLPGYRSVAVIREANTGTCANPVSDGDLMIDSIISPHNGRRYTSTQPGSGISVRLRDLYSSECSSYTVSYQVNGGLWQSFSPAGILLPAAGTAIVSIPGIDFSAPGTYSVTVAVQNTALTDPIPGNDTISAVVLTLANDTIDLSTPLTDGFERMPLFSVSHDSIGVSPNGYWDFYTQNDSGRLRSYVDDDVNITGSRSVNLDENRATTAGSMNMFTGTFNLSNYDTASTEIRIDFDYVLHGTPKTATGNAVWARGTDTLGWAPFFTYNLNAYPGLVNHVQSISLSDAISAASGNYSPSTQIAFGQNDTSLIATTDYGNGITLDNFKMYTVTNDAALLSIVNPLPTNCGLTGSTPLTVLVHNGVKNTLYNVQLFYTLDGGAVQSGAIDSITGKATINYTFPEALTLTPGTSHILNVWLSESGDSYTANDSILNYSFRNSVIISTYPYLENFESGMGGYYTEGINDSWQYGTPAAPLIHKAASGTKAWKTNLTGTYNNLELSYLYSPCFDLSSLSNPELSFSTAMDIENCGTTLCDAGYIEYSFDGATWAKLGAAGQGTNWYDSTFDIWNTEGFTRWHVASIPLPQPPTGGSLRFRFVLSSDPGGTYEGIAVDDIHIYDLVHAIYNPSATVSQTQDLSSGQWTDYIVSGGVLASVMPGQMVSSVTATLYAQNMITNPGATQYTFPRSYTIKTPSSPTDSVGIKLYLLDSDMVQVLTDTTCPSCSHFPDAYSLGVTQYDNYNNRAAENGTLADDTGGVFTFYPYTAITWVPYDQGYYAQLNVKPFSEFWFNDGGPTGHVPAGVDYLSFVAFRSGGNVTASWYSLIDTAVQTYYLQRSADSINYTDVLDSNAIHAATAVYSYNDPQSFDTVSKLFYRLKWTMTGSDSIYYSPVRSVSAYDTPANLVTFFAQMQSAQQVLAGWTSYIDPLVSYYTLERAVGNENFINIDVQASAQHYGQQYSYMDMPGNDITPGTPVYYRLTAVLPDASRVVLPIRTVIWASPNSVVNVFPNPTADGLFTIQWFAAPGTKMQLTITDPSGRKLYSAYASAAQWNNSTIASIQSCAHGVYFVTLDIGGSKYTEKIVYD